MKKAIRIIVPIVMAVAILLCLVWYFFIYDTAFTRDMFLDSARFFEKRGSHKIASTFYDLAYRQTSDNEDVAIELAKYHIKSGNFTQAEATLSAAIADGGNENLYIALCNTYLQQDKIMDAVSLLDNVTNPEIKAKLDSMRPNVPEVNIEPGFYSQYISISLTSDGNTIYATSNGTYPSIQQEPFSDSIALHDGENTVYAISVSEEGLVSSLGIFGYTIGGVIEQVQFEDTAIESAIRQSLNVDEDKILFTNDLWTITSFTVPEDVSSYKDLSKLNFLTELTVNKGISGQFSNISGLSNLITLEIRDTAVSSEELAQIGKLPSLENLTLSGCSLSTTKGLDNAAKIINLDLSKNTIRDIRDLEKLTGIKNLNLQSNVIVDLSALAEMKSLETLNVSYNTLADIDPVLQLNKLTYINASNNQITALGDMSSLTALTELNLSHNALTDVSAAASCVEIRKLNISNNALTDISSLNSLISMTDLDFTANQVTSLPEFSQDSALVNLNASENLLTSVAPLAGLNGLNKVYVDHNPDISDVNVLSGCSRLVLVNAYGTAVKDATKLIDLSVVVNYDPT